MKNLLYLSFFLIVIWFSSCSYKHDKDAHDRLISSHIFITEQIVSELNITVKYTSYQRIRIQFYLRDPSFKKHALIVEPKYESINKEVNDFDDLVLKKLNILIEKEENVSNWIEKEIHTHINTYKPFEKLNYIDKSTWTTIFYGKNSDEAITNSELIRSTLHKLRNSILITIADTMFDYKKVPWKLNKEDLKSHSIFQKKLEKKGSQYENELLEIYSLLTIPEHLMWNNGESVNWNKYLFYNKPLIGSISVFLNIRLDVRKAEKIAGEILFKRMKKNQRDEVIKNITGKPITLIM